MAAPGAASRHASRAASGVAFLRSCPAAAVEAARTATVVSRCSRRDPTHAGRHTPFVRQLFKARQCWARLVTGGGGGRRDGMAAPECVDLGRSDDGDSDECGGEGGADALQRQLGQLDSQIATVRGVGLPTKKRQPRTARPHAWGRMHAYLQACMHACVLECMHENMLVCVCVYVCVRSCAALLGCAVLLPSNAQRRWGPEFTK
eukprot:357381-Chlamydomonas_euryale.AAC.5